MELTADCCAGAVGTAGRATACPRTRRVPLCGCSSMSRSPVHSCPAPRPVCGVTRHAGPGSPNNLAAMRFSRELQAHFLLRILALCERYTPSDRRGHTSTVTALPRDPIRCAAEASTGSRLSGCDHPEGAKLARRAALQRPAVQVGPFRDGRRRISKYGVARHQPCSRASAFPAGNASIVLRVLADPYQADRLSPFLPRVARRSMGFLHEAFHFVDDDQKLEGRDILEQ